MFFLSLPAGVFADTLDRRKLLTWTTIFMTVLAGVLAVGAAFGSTGPALLLSITFLLGALSRAGGEFGTRSGQPPPRMCVNRLRSASVANRLGDLPAARAPGRWGARIGWMDQASATSAAPNNRGLLFRSRHQLSLSSG